MKKKRVAAVLVVFLFAVFYLIGTPLIWKWMYPIKYQEEIIEASRRYHVDPALILAIIRTESAFDHEQVSKKGAIGLMQLMPDTAQWVIRQAGFEPMAQEYLDNPKVNIDVGTWYVSFLLKKYNGNQVLAIAAYNAGPGKVNSWLEGEKWNGSRDHIEDIPYGETRHYVQRVLYYQERYRQIYQDELSRP